MNLRSRIDLESHPTSAKEARRLLADIREQELRIVEDDFERRKNRTQNFYEYIQRQLNHPSQVLPELIQNADDIQVCDTVQITLTEDTLCVRNNGRPMKAEEVDTLCAAGESTKHDPAYIGHFGLGFKSVFSISDNPRVKSGYFHFEFDSDRLTVPKILDTSEPINGTEIELPLKDDISVEERTELEERIENVHRLLPYLQNVSKIEVKQEEKTNVYRQESTPESPEQVIYRDGTLLERRLSFTTEERPSSEVLQQLLDERRIEDTASVKESPISVTISFEVDESHTPVSEESDGYLYNFLPTDERSGFPFDVHADFLLEPTRKSLAQRDGRYNQWLLQRVGDAFRKVIKYYRDRPRPQVGHLRLLPSVQHGQDHTEASKEAVEEAIRTEKSIPGDDERYHRPSRIVIPSPHVERVFVKSDVGYLLGRDIQYPSSVLDEALISTLREQSFVTRVSIEQLLKESEASVREGFSDADTAHLIVLAAALWDYWDSEYRSISRFSSKRDDRDEFERVIKETPIVPLESGERIAVASTPTEAVLPPAQGRSAYEIFEDEFQFVQLTIDTLPDGYPSDPSEVLDEARCLYSDVLGIETIGAETVLRDVVSDAFEAVESTDDKTLDTYLEFIFSNRNRWTAAKKHVELKFRTRDNDGESSYVDPIDNALFLPDSYLVTSSADEPAYSLENVLSELGASFVTEEYLDLPGGEQPVRWKKFLTKFGVLDLLPVNELPRGKRTFFEHRSEVKEKLSDLAEQSVDTDWEMPDSTKKGGQKDAWFRRNKRYALSDFVPSVWFEKVLTAFEEGEDPTLDRATAFGQMLQEHWDHYGEKVHRPLYYVVRRKAYRVREKQTGNYSTFAKRLRDTEWCLTKDNTLARPRTLLVENAATANQPPHTYVAEEDAPYLGPLGVNTQLGLGATLEQLSNARSVWKGREPTTIRTELTSRLDTLLGELRDNDSEVEKEIHESLSDARFIYVENSDPEFRSPPEVVWTGSNLGSYIISIESEYERYEELFRTIGVRDSLRLNDYLAYFDDTAWEEEDERDRIWRRLVRRLVSETGDVSSIEALDTDLRNQLSQASLMTLSDETVPLGQLRYYCHDEQIREHLYSDIESQVVRPYGARDYADETIAALWKRLGLTDLVEETTLTLTEHNAASSEETTDEAEEFAQLFVVAYSFCLEKGYEDACDELQRMHSEYQLIQHEEIKCRYLSVDGRPITEEFEVQSYVDRGEKQIRRTGGTDSLQDFTRRLPNELSLTATDEEQLQEILSGSLGKRDPYLDTYLDTFDIERQRLASEQDKQSEIQSDGVASQYDVDGPEQDNSDDRGESETINGGRAPEEPSSNEGRPNEDLTEVEGGEEEGPGSEPLAGPTRRSPGISSTPNQSSNSSGDLPAESETSSESTLEENNIDGQSSAKEDPKSVNPNEGDVPESVAKRRIFTTRTARNNKFRESVREAYGRTCAVCGSHRETKRGSPEVEAAHIRPASDGGPDSVQNGLALCRLHHWAFENGWITVTDEYEVSVRDWESVPGYDEFSQYDGESILLPDDETKYPSSTYLQYHRESTGFEG
ncbi:sacsin N-terminal ATP-binding-like domain-containing protein [Haloferax sulfurifontis]|uniref:sacsin N-terminal ATP-binding-like domain-containing protein n=1 Tax=Haloferax sulfurifontis TaxID=255616 RepID=UPI0009FC2124|nr:HNH endonuclease [Haloferax sulfurifontis]